MYNEKRIILTVGAIQFINILDAMMVIPLGPDLATDLGIAASKVGYLAGAYTGAAAVSALLAAFFLDRFNRRTAVIIALLGLVLGTFVATLGNDLTDLVLARILAGSFGGPATALSMAIIIDTVAPARRGRAMGAVMSAFSIASVLGVPLGLELAHRGGWQTPFYVISAAGLLVAMIAYRVLPPIKGQHGQTSGSRFTRLLLDRRAQMAYLTVSVAIFAGFLIIPNIATYVIFNLGYPRDGLGMLYLIGGLVSFFAMRLTGKGVDRWGSFPIGSLASLLLALDIYLGFYRDPALLPVMVLFVGFMLAMSMRAVAVTSLVSHIPHNQDRAGFMAVSNSAQHLASALGGICSTFFLTEMASGALLGVGNLALTAIAVVATLPFLLYWLSRRVVIPTHD